MAAELQKRLGLPIAHSISNYYHLFLVHTDNRLELQPAKHKNVGPVYVDFSSKTMQYRLQHGGGLKQLLARAAGLKQGYRPHILDATAGLGRDGFVLASLGCQVTMLERNPIVAALLEDGLRRGRIDPNINDTIQDNIAFISGDSLSYLRQLQPKQFPDTIYLDPMYPERSKSAMIKKEMRILRLVAGEDLDAPALLDISLDCATSRVVVKRSKTAPCLQGRKPSLSLKAENSRYDIYLTKSSI